MRIKIDNDIYFNKETLIGVSIQAIENNIARYDEILSNPVELSSKGVTDLDELLFIREQNIKLENEKINFTVEKAKLISLLQEIGIDGY